jgi:CheY-like chemotaxis protein
MGLTPSWRFLSEDCGTHLDVYRCSGGFSKNWTRENNGMQCNRILIIEDEQTIRETLKESLELEGYPVFTAKNGREGLDILENSADSYCLILLDLMMPVMNGFEFLASQQKNKKIAPIPVVIVSAFPDQAQKVKANGFVKKPIDLDHLLTFIKRYCS